MARVRVAFNAFHLSERGTPTAVYHYAVFNETLLGNDSRVLCPAGAELSNLDHFQKRLSVHLYRNQAELAELLRDVDLYYTITSGLRPDSALMRPPHGRTAVHGVFRAHQPHGDVYASISPWVSRVYGAGAVPVVPLVVHLPDEDSDLRHSLGISPHFTVFGRHGGYDSFNIRFAKDAVAEALSRRDDVFFLFMNTRPFLEHPRCAFLPRCHDERFKVRFVNSCDFMLHARAEGECFGLAVGEFSLRNKPVITYRHSRDRAHCEILGERAFYYGGPDELLGTLLALKPMSGEWGAYGKAFTPDRVMPRFREVFLS